MKIREDQNYTLDIELMGHKDVKTTLSYIGTSLKEKTEAILRMPRLIRKLQ